MLTKSIVDTPAHVERWHIAIIKGDDSIELLAQSFATREQAYTESLRCYSWFKLVRVGIVPAALDFKLLTVTHDPFKGKPMDLEIAAGA